MVVRVRRERIGRMGVQEGVEALGLLGVSMYGALVSN